MSIAMVHFIAAVVLFYLVNWVGARSISVGYMQMSIIAKEETAPAFNFLFKVLSPIVFLILFIVVVQTLNHKEFVQASYLIVVYYWLFRTFVIILLGRRRLTNWKLHFIYWVVSIVLSIWIYSLVEQVDKLLPTPRSLLDQMWILIIMFLYSVFNNIELSRAGILKRKEDYICHQYAYFKKKYGVIISKHCENDFYEVATYSILICENFNRPTIVRWVEYLRFFLTRTPHTLGVMQVRTNKYINDGKSIVKAIDIIKQAGLKHKQKVATEKNEYSYDSPNSALYEIAGCYNCNNVDYQSEVCSIYETVKENYDYVERDYESIVVV
ncbi:MAG: hypothetical protein J5671_05550 [Bacteroidaceae bacterium]|nr:hypothetical protein [Bacteroidaceae bacterium]